MTATWTTLRAPQRAVPASLPLPKPQPVTAPVLITDCASPLAGETLLSLFWKRLDREGDHSA